MMQTDNIIAAIPEATAHDAPKIFVVQGATASGKSAVAIELAQYLPIEIISADSRQIYRYLDIGTAKPTAEERAHLPHYLVDILNPDQAFNAGMFARESEVLIADIIRRGKIPLIVGGTGLYISALCEEMFSEPENSDYSHIRQELQYRLDSEGKDVLYNELQSIDAASAEKYADKNPRRIVRALEYYYVHGVAISQARITQNRNANLNVTYFAVQHEREELYKRINKRSELMWQSGLVEETAAVLQMGYSPQLNALNTVGYKEAIAYLQNAITRERGLELTAQNTRHYAKRQMTWLRNHGTEHQWLSGTTEAMALAMKETIDRILNL